MAHTFDSWLVLLLWMNKDIPVAHPMETLVALPFLMTSSVMIGPPFLFLFFTYLSCDHHVVSYVTYCPSDAIVLVMFIVLFLFISHHCSCDPLSRWHYCSCDIYCLCDSIVLVYNNVMKRPPFLLFTLLLPFSCHVIIMWSHCDSLFLWHVLFCHVYCSVTHCPG